MATGVKVPVSEWACVVLEEIDWDAYLALRANPANDRVRMTYLDGTLHLMSPEHRHEFEIERLGLLIRMVCKALDMTALGAGSTTLRRGPRRRGRRGAAKEPDSCFYFGENERKMRQRKSLDLEVDPPPDLAIEVINKSDSPTARFVYARLGVPEVWRFAPNENPPLIFHRLSERGYRKIDRSRCLPVLTPALVIEALAMGDTEEVDDIAWMDLILDWARVLPRPPA